MCLSVAVAACVVAAAALGAPVTKQNGKSPAFSGFTSICTLAPYLFYGDCAGDADEVHQRPRPDQRHSG